MVYLKAEASDLPSPVKKFDRSHKEVGQKKIQGEAHKTLLHTNLICEANTKIENLRFFKK